MSSAGDSQLAEGRTLIRSTDSEIQRIAIQNPRDERKILDAALSEIDLVPEVADQNIYSIPHKKHRQGCPDRLNCDCPAEYVEGLSVRAAENLVRRWGNCDVRSGILEVGDDYAVVVGVFLDFETMARRTEERRVSRMEARRDGGTYSLNASRWETKIAKEASIAGRNVTLKALPSWLRKRIFDRSLAIVAGQAKEEADQKKTLPWKQIIAAYKGLGVSREQIEALMGKKMPKLDEQEVARLRVLFGQIRNGEQQAHDVFPMERSESAPGASVDKVLADAQTQASSHAAERTDETANTEARLLLDEAINEKAREYKAPHAAKLRIREALSKAFETEDFSTLTAEQATEAVEIVSTLTFADIQKKEAQA